MGKYYEEIKNDFNEAVKWYEKSVNQNNKKAQNDLGLCYLYGDGVDKDIKKSS